MLDLTIRCLGFGLIVFILIDSFYTVLTLKGSGPITRHLSRMLWSSLLYLHKCKPTHGLLSLAGPLLLLSIILIWYISIVLGWYLVFLSEPNSVLVNSSGEVVSALEKLYFTGVTAGNLGYGDLVPNGYPWTLLATLSTFMCAFVISTAVAYILPVVSAAVSQQRLARAINSLGQSPDQIYEIVFRSADSDAMKSHLASLSAEYETLARQYLSYPILAYFHVTDSRSAIFMQTLKLSLALLKQEQQATSRGVESVALSAIRSFNEQANRQRSSKLMPNRDQNVKTCSLVSQLQSLIDYDGWTHDDQVFHGVSHSS